MCADGSCSRAVKVLSLWLPPPNLLVQDASPPQVFLDFFSLVLVFSISVPIQRGDDGWADDSILWCAAALEPPGIAELTTSLWVLGNLGADMDSLGSWKNTLKGKPQRWWFQWHLEEEVWICGLNHHLSMPWNRAVWGTMTLGVMETAAAFLATLELRNLQGLGEAGNDEKLLM